MAAIAAMFEQLNREMSMNQELIRIVDGIARDKNIERDQIYSDIEQAIASGLRKQFDTEDASEFAVSVDRTSGDISATRQGQAIPLNVVGRIGAQTVKQVMIQLIRQDERGSIYEEFKDRVGTIVTGTIARFEGGTMIVSLGRSEGIMPRSEQIPGENHQVGERIQALIMEVRDTLSAVKIILSRSHPEFIPIPAETRWRSRDTAAEYAPSAHSGRSRNAEARAGRER